MIIPWDKLSGPALESIIEEFVLREGTEYGQKEFSLDQKKSDVKRQECSHFCLHESLNDWKTPIREEFKQASIKSLVLSNVW